MDEEKTKIMEENKQQLEDSKANAEIQRANRSSLKVKTSKSGAKKAIKKAIIHFVAIVTLLVFSVYVVLGPLFNIYDALKNLTLNNMGLTLPNADSSAQSTLGKMYQGVGKFFKKLLGQDTEQVEYWIDLEAESKFLVDKDTGTNIAYIDEETNQNLLLSRTAVVKTIKESGKVPKNTKLIDLTQNQLYALTNYYLENFQEGEYEEKKYTLLDNYIKELGIEGISLRGLNLLGEAEYDDVNEILEDEDTKELVEKYIAEFLRADIITQQPHKTEGIDLVDPDNEYHVDGGIFLYRTKEEKVLPGKLLDELSAGGYKEVEVEDEDYTRMKYILPEDMLYRVRMKPGELYKPYYSSVEEAKADIRNKGFRKILAEMEKDFAESDGMMMILKTVFDKVKYMFTQDPDTDEIVMIEYKVSQEEGTYFLAPLVGIGKSVEDATKYTISAKYSAKLVSLPYKDKIAKYIMPYEFLIALLEITQNPEFVYHVALLARDTNIVLVVQDKEKLQVTTTDIMKPDAEAPSGWVPDIRILNPLVREYTPIMQIKYADTWNWHEEFYHMKKVNVERQILLMRTRSI